MKITTHQTILTTPRLMLMSSCLLLVLPACKETKDPSYEKEALKLSAEKAALEVRLEEAKKQVDALQAKVRNAENERDAAKTQAAQNTGKIDPDKIKRGFADRMAELEKDIESNFPHLSVKSWTVQKMDLQTDYPFTTGLMMTLVNKSTGQTQDKYWEARGNTQGEWKFAQRSAPKTTAAANPRQPTTAPSSNPGSPTAANPPAGRPATNPAPQTRPQPTPTRPKPASNGKTHVIDWGSLR